MWFLRFFSVGGDGVLEIEHFDRIHVASMADVATAAEPGVEVAGLEDNGHGGLGAGS